MKPMAHTALVTGASRGLGSAIAWELAHCGVKVAVNYKDSGAAAEALCHRIEMEGGQAAAFRADVRDESEVLRLVSEVSSVLGPVDILVVNATGPQPFYSIEDQTWESYLEQLEFFVKSP